MGHIIYVCIYISCDVQLISGVEFTKNATEKQRQGAKGEMQLGAAAG
jgi:hypothetical protein